MIQEKKYKDKNIYIIKHRYHSMKTKQAEINVCFRGITRHSQLVSAHTSTCKQGSFPARKEAARCRLGMMRVAGRCSGASLPPRQSCGCFLRRSGQRAAAERGGSLLQKSLQRRARGQAPSRHFTAIPLPPS